MGVHIPVVEVSSESYALSLRNMQGKSGTFSRSSEVFAKRLTPPCSLFIINSIGSSNIDNKTKILVVDDDPDLLPLTGTVLRRAGHEVLEASTGTEGLEKARAHRPDVVLLDVVLPDISGIEACRQIKEDQDLKDIFVILTSGVQTSSEYQANGLNLGPMVS